MSVAAGRLVGRRYRLLAVIGRGGTGTVWRAHDERLGRQVAVKEVHFPGSGSDQELALLRERTLREARAASRLNHIGVITVYDVVEDDGRPWIVMELVRARTLAERVNEEGPLSVDATAQVGLAVLDALTAAHRAGVVHRDVKPSNIMLAADGRVTLTDFGIAQAQGDPSLTSTGLLVGSPAYVSPERVAGRAAGPAADLWGLGATLFFAVEGHAAFAGPDTISTLLAISRGERTPYLRAGALAPLLDQLLEPDPQERVGAAAAAQALRGLAGPPVARAAPPAAAASPAPAAPPAPAPPAPVLPLDPAPAVGAVPTRAVPVPARLRDPGEATTASRAPRRRLVGAGAAVVVAGAAVAAVVASRPGPHAPVGAAAAPMSAATRSGGSTSPSGPARGSSAGAPATSGARASRGSATSPASSTETPTATTGGPVDTALPLRVTDRAGWQVSLPATWREVSAPGGREWRDPVTGTSVLVAYQPVADPNPVGAWVRQEAGSRHAFPGYQRISIAPVQFRGFPAADWEFTYTGGHALDRGFAANGHGQALFLQSRPAQWVAARRQLDAIAAAFVPAP